MMLEDDLAALRQVPFFARMPDEPLRLLAFGTGRVARRKGQRVFTAGAPALTAYVVLDGAVELSAPGGGDPGSVLGPGSLIGEYALLCETTRPQTAVMAEDGTLLEIPRPLMRRVLDEFPEVADELLRDVAAHLAATIADLDAARRRFLAIDREGEG